MKLWVDDIRNAPDETWTVARTVNSAIKAISHWDFEEISLDHDISHQVSIGTKLERPFPCEETFMAVAYFIAEKYDQTSIGGLVKPPKIIIHTSNVPAGKEMQDVLKINGIPSECRHVGLANRLEMEV